MDCNDHCNPNSVQILMVFSNSGIDISGIQRAINVEIFINNKYCLKLILKIINTLFLYPIAI